MDGSNNSWGDGSNLPQGHPPSYQGPPPPTYQAPPPLGYPPYFPMPPHYYPAGFHGHLPMPGSPPMQYPPYPNQLYRVGAHSSAQPTTVVTDEEVQVVNAAEPSLSAIDKRGKTKLANFHPQEDVYLVKGWLEISCDPIVGTGQKSDCFWKRVLGRYNARRGEFPARSLRSLQSRWNNTLKPQVSKFASYYANAIRENRSGMSDADKTSLACANFAECEGHNFSYMHAWDLLKDEPKWTDPAEPGARTEAAGAGIKDTSLDSNRTNAGASNASAKRPIGRDRAKAASKRSKSSDTSSSDYASRTEDLSLQKLNMLQEDSARKGEHFQHLAAIDEKRYQEMRCHNESVLEIERQKVQLMIEQQRREREEHERKEDERILSIDLDTCAPRLRAYYETCQEEILLKLAARRNSRPGPGA